MRPAVRKLCQDGTGHHSCMDQKNSQLLFGNVIVISNHSTTVDVPAESHAAVLSATFT